MFINYLLNGKCDVYVFYLHQVWARLFFSTLFLSLIFNAIDIGSDTLILIR